tara:strand:- start:512 stop:2638 length:2127 start_codon:yes stop_codon:yes gene_type:complete
MTKSSLERDFLKASSLLRKGNKLDAESIYRNILKRFPKNNRARLALKKMNKTKPNSELTQDFLNRSMNELSELYKNGHIKNALYKAQDLGQKFPESYKIQNFLGICAAQTQSFTLSENAFRKAVMLKANYADAHNNLGNVLKAQGRLKEATKCFKTALKINPDFAEAYNNLGIALKEQRNTSGAILAYKKALKIKPHYSEALNNLGYTTQNLGQLNDAIEFYKRAIEIRPNYAEAYNNLGNAFREKGDLKLAIYNFKKALTIHPDYYKAQLNLAAVFDTQLNRTEALTVLKRAIKFNPKRWEAYQTMGSILRKIDKPKEALRLFKAAEAMKDKKTDVFLNIAICLQDMGKYEEALKYLKEIIKEKPDSVEAYRLISMLKIYSLEDPDISRMQSLYGTNLIEKDHIQICFALAKVFKDLGQIKKSFDFLKEGNACQKRLLNYEISQDQKLFSRIRQAARHIQENTLKVSKKSSLPTPIFILGMPRSGTTLIEQIISSHTQVAGAGELEDIHFHGASLSIGDKKCSEKAIKEFRHIYLEKISKISQGSPYVTDKMPQNFLSIALICSAFPEAKIVHTKRLPAATCWSNFKEYFPNGLNYSFSLDDIIHYYSLYEDLMMFWNQYYKERIYHLNYESLTQNQNSETRDLISYLGLNWEDRCLYPEKNNRNVRTASQNQVRTKIYRGSSDEWKKYRPFLEGKFDRFENYKNHK